MMYYGLENNKQFIKIISFYENLLKIRIHKLQYNLGLQYNFNEIFLGKSMTHFTRVELGVNPKNIEKESLRAPLEISEFFYDQK